jgi:sugar lactone lactonase YvrE
MTHQRPSSSPAVVVTHLRNVPARAAGLWLLRATLIVAATGMVTWLAMPSPVVSLGWHPSPAPPLEGAFANNGRLRTATAVPLPDGATGPEHVVIDEDGSVWASLADGRIMRRSAETWTMVVNTQGRPLGFAHGRGDTADRWFIADAVRGLLSFAPSTGQLEVIASDVEGLPLYWTNAVAVARDGTVFFTSSTSVWAYDKYTEDILDQRPTGRVLRYHPKTGVAVIARDLCFANGVVLLPDESALIVAETGRYRLWRVGLSAELQGVKDVFVHNLPGFPDNLTLSPNNTIWVALAASRKRMLDWVHPYAFIKDPLSTLPPAWRPKPPMGGFVIEFDLQGTPLHSLQDEGGLVIAESTVATQHDGHLWVGTLHGGLFDVAL